MLIGQYAGKIGAKGRVAFPKKFRDALGDRLIITQGYENSLIVVSEEGWKGLLAGTEGKPFTFGPKRETERFLLGGATELELDSKGRFIIPSYLRDHAGAAQEIVFVGLLNYVEIWDKKHWEEYQANLKKNIATIAEKLGGEDKT